MEIASAPASPVREVYARMRRLSDAIDDPDSSLGQRRRWHDEYVDLAGELAGQIGARAAGGAVLLDRATRRCGDADGFVPRVPLQEPASKQRRTDIYL